MRMVSEKRKEAPVTAFFRIVSVEPQRNRLELPVTVNRRLIMQNKKRSPPIAMSGKKRPQNVHIVLFACNERSDGKIIGLFLEERPDLNRR